MHLLTCAISNTFVTEVGISSVEIQQYKGRGSDCMRLRHNKHCYAKLCDALRNLVLFVQINKREKHP